MAFREVLFCVFNCVFFYRRPVKCRENVCSSEVCDVASGPLSDRLWDYVFRVDARYAFEDSVGAVD